MITISAVPRRSSALQLGTASAKPAAAPSAPAIAPAMA